MKKLLTLLLFSFCIVSCKKEENKPEIKYTCTCDVSDAFMHLYTTTETYKNVSYSQAYSNCQDEKTHQENLVGPKERSADCTLR